MSKGQRRPPWVAIPVELPLQMERAGLDASTQMLNIAAWTYCAQQATDGRVPRHEACRLPYFSPRRHDALVRAGFWRSLPDAVELAGYRAVNPTLAKIEAQRAANTARQRRLRERAATVRAEAEPTDAHSARHAERHASRHGLLPSPLPSPSPEADEGDVNVGSDDQDVTATAGPDEVAEVAAPTSRGPRPMVADEATSSGRERVRARRRKPDSGAERPAYASRWEDQAWAPVRDAWGGPRVGA